MKVQRGEQWIFFGIFYLSLHSKYKWTNKIATSQPIFFFFFLHLCTKLRTTLLWCVHVKLVLCKDTNKNPLPVSLKLRQTSRIFCMLFNFTIFTGDPNSEIKETAKYLISLKIVIIIDISVKFKFHKKHFWKTKKVQIREIKVATKFYRSTVYCSFNSQQNISRGRVP